MKKDMGPEEYVLPVCERMVLTWKLSKALYEQYGGGVIWQQFNPLEPVGAYLAFLKEHEKKGSFEILDADYKDRFWSYFTRDYGYKFIEDVDYSTPWWKELKRD